MALCRVLKLSAIFIVFFVYLADCGRVKRIIEGHEIPCGMHPRVVALKNVTSQKHLCGATLLSPKAAVTAAHCCYGLPNEYVLQLNNYCVDDEELPKAKVIEIYKHESYNKYSRAHDIAIISIDMDLEDKTWLENTILPENVNDDIVPEICIIAGYGVRTRHSLETTEKLHAANINIITPDDCLYRLGEYMAPSNESGQICAVGVGGSDTCMGDSGGPILCSSDTIIRGISSYGQSCGCPGVPGVYTSIQQHLDWIKDTLNVLENKGGN